MYLRYSLISIFYIAFIKNNNNTIEGENEIRRWQTLFDMLVRYGKS